MPEITACLCGDSAINSASGLDNLVSDIHGPREEPQQVTEVETKNLGDLSAVDSTRDPSIALKERYFSLSFRDRVIVLSGMGILIASIFGTVFKRTSPWVLIIVPFVLFLLMLRLKKHRQNIRSDTN